MATNLVRYKNDLKALIELGESLVHDMLGQVMIRDHGLTAEEQELVNSKLSKQFGSDYQKWYTTSLAVIKQLQLDRAQEFQDLYKGDGKRKSIEAHTYNIQDWLNGIRARSRPSGLPSYDDLGLALMRMQTQQAILRSVEARFESSLHDIRQLVQADLFDSELDAARALAKSGFARCAGAIAGVVLEKHLGQVAMNHAVKVTKKHPTINDLNEALKSKDVLDVPAWRNVQRLGDLRNLCDHNKHREPTLDEVNELIDGVDKTTKTLF